MSFLLGLAFLSFFALICPPLNAQTPSHSDDKAAFTTLSIKDGLANPSVSGIVQDSKGFIWLATQGGLCRYDGSEFTTFENEPFDENSLSGDLVQTIFRDKDDTLWLGTYNGLNRFTPEEGIFHRYRFDASKDNSLSNDLIIAIARDARGSLWAGTLNGLNRLDEKTGTFKRYFHDDKDPYSIPNNTIRSLFCDSRGRLWVGTTGGGFASYDYEQDRFENLTATTAGGQGFPPSDSVQSITEDENGDLWIGAWGRGAIRYSPLSGESKVFSFPDNRIYVVNAQEKGVLRVGTWGGGLHVLSIGSGSIDSYRTSKAIGTLPNDVVYSILQDASGEVWVGTNGGGLARFDHTRKSFTAYVADPNDPGALPSGKVISSLVDRKGQIWVSVYSNGIHRWDPVHEKWIHYRHSASDPASLGDDTCNFMYEDSEGILWICTNVGLSRFNRDKDNFTTYLHRDDNPNTLSSSIIYSLIEDSLGNFWVGTYTTGLDYWDRKAGKFTNYRFSPTDVSSLSDNLITSLIYDGDGKLWIGTNNGLNRYEKGRFVRYNYSPKNKTGISNNSVQRLVLDSKGILWVSTRGGGLNRYSTESDSFTHFMRKDGLPSNIVYNVLDDKSGGLWIVTQSGLALYDRNTGTIKRISLYKELENLSFTSGTCRSETGDLYFGSMGMFIKFDPRRYDTNSHVPPVYITQIKAANNEKLTAPASSSASTLHLEYWENSMEIRFAALDFRDPRQNQFAYKLEGFDKTWTYSSTRNFATYTNLPGGTYNFRVKAANNDGLWNDAGASIPIAVASSPFLSPLALAGYLIVILLMGYGLAKIRSNRILAQKVRQLTQTEGQLKEAWQEAARLAEEAKKANAAKSEFIAIVSHEIRTPINGVIGMTELLSRTELSKAQEEYVRTIQESGGTLLGLINEVLDFSKLEAGRVELESIPFDLKELVEKTRIAFSHQAAAKELSLGSFYAEDLPRAFIGDPLRLGQILSNLMSNAVKFTDRGEVRLAIERDPAHAAEGSRIEGPRHVKFSMSDTGIGITQEQMAGLFKPFSQADQSTTRRYGGTGLGLSIIKKYIDLMGGELSVESEYGKGSVFSFSLPLFEARGEVKKPEAPEIGEGESAEGLAVLVVDDDPVNRHVAVKLLEALGAETGEAESGPAAIVALGKRRYDLVFMDYMMPGMDGFETTRRIRNPASGAINPLVPIVAMTARAQPEDRARCLAGGMNEYIAKPITLGALEPILISFKRASERKPRPRALAEVHPEEREAAEPAVFNADNFSSRYSGSPEVAIEILGLYLDQARPILDLAEEASGKGDLEGVANAMHRLKGCSGAIGATQLVRMAGSLEEAIRSKTKPADAVYVGEKVGEIGPELTRLEAEIRDYLARK